MKFKYLYLLFPIVSLLLIGGTYATWQYYNPANPESGDVNVNFDEWYYEENLPGGGSNASEDFNHGISHADLIKDIVNDIGSNDSLIMGAIEGAIDDSNNHHNGVGSSTKYNDSSLRDFAGAHGYGNLGFFIYYGEGITDASQITTLEIYTYNLQDTKKSVGTYIEVYKTIATLKEDTWLLTGGWRGTAQLVKYGNSNTVGSYKNVIDPKTWTKAE